jgi:hypothetical protein
MCTKLQSSNFLTKNPISRIPIADIFLTRRKRQILVAIADVIKDDDLIQRTTKRSIVTTSIHVNNNQVIPPSQVEQVQAVLAVVNDNDDQKSSAKNYKNSSSRLLTKEVDSETERTPKIINDDKVVLVSNDDLSNAKQTAEKNYDYYDYEYPDYFDDPVSNAEVQGQVDIINDLPPDIYCDLVNTLNEKCLETSLLEIWKFNEKAIRSLTSEDIIEAVNKIKESPHYGHKVNYADLLGDITRDPVSGRIVAAKSAFHLWVTKVNPNAIMADYGGTGIELDLADATSLEWEDRVLNTMLDFDQSLANITILVNVARRYLKTKFP